MLLVKTKIGNSKISGIGLFADEDISKGTVIWKFVKKFDAVFTQEEIAKWPTVAQEIFYKYSYLNLKTGLYVLCGDDARHFNHSDEPNCIDVQVSGDDEGEDVAVRDIKAGEELTVNYHDYDGEVYRKLSGDRI